MAHAGAPERNQRGVAITVVGDAAQDLHACTSPGCQGGDSAAQHGWFAVFVTGRPAEDDYHPAATLSYGTRVTSPRPASRSGRSTWAVSPTITIDISATRT